jgi:hypothetical protein
MRYWRAWCERGGVADPGMPETFQVREPGDPISFQHVVLKRSANLTEGTADMNADGKSDDFVLPATQANKAETSAAEFVEGRRSPKGSVIEWSSMFRTLSRIQHQWSDTVTTTGIALARDRMTQRRSRMR